MRPLVFTASAATLLLVACHQPDQPPVPPKPTNPTNRAALAYFPAEVIDASIVSESGPVLNPDGHIFELDSGAVVR
jgi:hypothetical protein